MKKGGPVDIRQSRYEATLFSDGTPVFEVEDLHLERGTSYIVYAIGDFFAGPFELFIQTIDLDNGGF